MVHKRSLEFVHIPKTAGTTIEDVARRHNIKWGRHNRSTSDRAPQLDPPCSYWHRPTRSFDSDTFCVFREPASRVVSEYGALRRNQGRECNEHDLNQWVDEMLNSLPRNATATLSLSLSTYGDIQLRFSHLTDDFDNLMAEYDLPMRLDDLPPANTSRAKCDVSVADLSESSLGRIHDIYSADYDACAELGGC